MLKRLLLCLAVILLVCTACVGPPKDVNIMCYGFQEDMFRILHGAGLARDETLANVNCITEEDYESYTDWYESAYTGLLTRSGDIDIFLLNSMDDKAYKILKDHYFEDLSQDEQLMGYFDAMYPPIREWSKCGDEIFGLPFYIGYPMGILVDEERMGSVGYTMEDIGTVGGLLDFCDAWSEHNTTPPTEQTLYVHFYYYNYILNHYNRDTGELDLDTPQFRSLLAQCRQYRDTEYLQDDDDLPYVELDKPVLLCTGNPMVDKDNFTLGYYPLLEGEVPGTKRYADIRYFIINPSSKNKEQAFKYMNLLAETTKYNRWACDPLFREKEFYQSDLLMGGDYVTHDRRYSEEQFAMVNNFLEEQYVGYGFPGFSEIRRILYEYIEAGSQTMDEAIAEAQNLLDTIRQEQYIGE